MANREPFGPTTSAMRREASVAKQPRQKTIDILKIYTPLTTSALKDQLVNQGTLDALTDHEAFWAMAKRFEQALAASSLSRESMNHLHNLFFRKHELHPHARRPTLEAEWTAIDALRNRIEDAGAGVRPLFAVLSSDPMMYSEYTMQSPVVQTIEIARQQYVASENRDRAGLDKALASAVLADTVHTLHDQSGFERCWRR